MLIVDAVWLLLGRQECICDRLWCCVDARHWCCLVVTRQARMFVWLSMMLCRCSSLMLSVNHLAMLAKTACSLSGVLDWVDQSLADVEEHLKVCAFHLNEPDYSGHCQFASKTCSLHSYYALHSIYVYMSSVPSVLSHCWLGGRKGIRSKKNWVVECWHGYLSGTQCRLAYGPADATPTLWYQLTWVVPEKGR